MNILIDATGLPRASNEARTYAREMVRHLLLAAEWRAYSILGWSEPSLGSPWDFLAPLPLSARARIQEPAEERGAIVYCPIGLPSSQALAGARSVGVRARWCVGTVLDERPRGGSPRAEGVVTLTHGTLRELAGSAGPRGARFRWIPPGLSHELSLDAAAAGVPLPEGPYILAAGLSPPVSTEALFAAWRLLKAFRLLRRCAEENGHEAKPTLAFLPGATLPLRQAAACLGLSDAVVFLPGEFRDPFWRTRALASAEVYVHVSRPDASWLIAREAMGRGVPLVAPRSGPFPEVCADCAWYYEDGNPRKLAQALHEVLACRDLRRCLSQRGIARGQAFSWEASARHLLDLFADVERTASTPTIDDAGEICSSSAAGSTRSGAVSVATSASAI